MGVKSTGSKWIIWISNSPFRTILNFLDSLEGSEMQDAHKANSIIAPRSKFLFFLILIDFYCFMATSAMRQKASATAGVAGAEFFT